MFADFLLLEAEPAHRRLDPLDVHRRPPDEFGDFPERLRPDAGVTGRIPVEEAQRLRSRVHGGERQLDISTCRGR